MNTENGMDHGGRCAALSLRVLGVFLVLWLALPPGMGVARAVPAATAGTTAPASATGDPAAPAGATEDSLAAPASDDPDPREEDRLPPPLPRFSEGGILFVADAAAFPGPDSSSSVEFYLRVANEQLRFKPGPSGLEALVQVDLRLFPRAGGAPLQWSRLSRLAAADSESAGSVQLRQVLQWSVNLGPGQYLAELKLTDLGAPKKTLLGMLRHEHVSGTVRALLGVRPFPGDSLVLSDLEFAEGFAPPDSSVFRKPRVTVYPNPGRRYGTSGTDLRVFLTGRLPAGTPADTLRMIWEIFDSRGARRMLWADTLRAVPDFDRAEVLRLGSLPAGRYRLRLTARPAAGPARLVEGGFDMAWASGAALERSIVDRGDMAQLLLGDEDLDRFEDMTAGEQESFWNEYWTRRRNSPESAMGDPLAEFEYRVQQANRTFGGNEKGLFTDRGRIFVRYGAADEVRQRVMPVGGESLSDLGSDLALEGDAVRGETLRQMGAQGRGDSRSYEIWDYDLHGRMIFGTRARQARHGSHMRFIFVDETGVGNYVLKYSSE
jgi:GWxTD domain-containing protein